MPMRLKAHWFHILLALSESSHHGSGIVRSVLEQTDDELRLWPATLYGSLADLVERRWIEELTRVKDRPEGESEKKRIYRITKSGARVLAAEANRLDNLARTAMSRLSAAGLIR
jgi:PadR family transcriptional regulator PadR